MGVEKRDVEIKATRNDAGTQTANQLIASDWKVAGFEYSPATHITVHFWREIPDPPAEPGPLACFKEIPTIPLQSPADPQQVLTEHDLHPPERTDSQTTEELLRIAGGHPHQDG